MWWLKGEFRASVIKSGEIVEFVPSDEGGNKLTGMVVQLHDDKAAQVAATWSPSDRVFFYHELGLDREEIGRGFFNDRTKGRISIAPPLVASQEVSRGGDERPKPTAFLGLSFCPDAATYYPI
jgi:hypothetical protein